MTRLAAPLALTLAVALAAPVAARAQTIIGIPEGQTPGPALAPTAQMAGPGAMRSAPAPAAAPAPAPAQGQTIPGDARPGAGPVDDAATVLADHLSLDAQGNLAAQGGVVVWYQGARLVAAALAVDGATGTLSITGPIHLSRPGAAMRDEVIIIADAARLDRSLQDGILRGVRLLIAQELQMAATEVSRSGAGRYLTMRHVVASSCQICAANPTPLWEIRARAITHDRADRSLTLEHPQLRAFGVPVAAVPLTITAPDPTQTRRSGFLRPEFRTTSGLGFGVKTPYFITLGPSADLLVTPYVAASRTHTLGLRYRQALAQGDVQIEGAISRDDIAAGTRGYVFGTARFDLPRDYRLGLELQHASDRGYLLDYDVTAADRLWSGVTLDRVRGHRLFAGRVGAYESLRDDEDNATSPTQVADVIWQRRMIPELIGGEALMEWSVHGHRRPSPGDQIGRDMARASFALDWRRSTILPGGVVGAALAGLEADFYHIENDSRYARNQTRITPLAGVELRWPLIGRGGGVTHIVEPVAQILYSPRLTPGDIPNEDSTLIEFDEGNLLAASRFPGWDARESGLRANLGLSWTMAGDDGAALRLTAGRVVRARPDPAFGPDSPLADKRSDWLLAAHYDSAAGLVVANRALFDDALSVSRNELRAGWLAPGLQVTAGWLWIDRDATEARVNDANEVTLAGGWQIAPGWWGSAETRYDFSFGRAQNAALGVQYRNECVTVDLGVRRRFTASDSVRPETDMALSLRLGGFGQAADGPGTVARRSCMR